jgi:hypothetical protein
LLEERRVPTYLFWSDYGHDPQHTADSQVPAQAVDSIFWSTPVDLHPQYSGNDLLIHYGSPLVTPNNTVLVPVKTGTTGGFEVVAFNGNTGQTLWSQPTTTDYTLPPHNWTPSYQPALGGVPDLRMYYAGNGGTIYYIDHPDTSQPSAPVQVAFFGLSNYQANPSAYNNSVFINTPLTVDGQGNVYFGFYVTGPNPLNLKSGIARIDAGGGGSWVAASVAAGNSSIIKVVHNCAPAIGNAGRTLYIAVSTGDFGSGYLLALDSGSLATTGKVLLKDPDGNTAALPDDGTASPMVGPDGDVYFGVLENPFPYNNDRGWMLHYDGTLTQTKITGAFGWDDTASVVPATMVPGYIGPSTYLLFTKYNNYAGVGTGNGKNKVAVLDPNATEVDPITGKIVMNEVLTMLGPTPDPAWDQKFPGAVREWCINSAAVDPYSDSILVNSEDGTLYRWNLASNTLTQKVALTSGIGEAYTPTVVGVDGTVYAVSNATLFVVGEASGSHFSISAPTDVTAGSPFTITVTGQEASNITDPDYTGPVGFTSSDSRATLPGGYFFTGPEQGAQTFTGVILRGAGSRTITVVDGRLTGTVTLKVHAATASHLNVVAPAAIKVGSAFNFTVQAEDAFNNIVGTYTGTVSFKSSDQAASLPKPYTFTSADKGQHTFSATFNTLGSQTLTATDAGGLTGSAVVTVTATSAAPGTSLTTGSVFDGLSAAEVDPLFARQRLFGAGVWIGGRLR